MPGSRRQPTPRDMVPPSFAATSALSRRSFLRSAALAGAVLGTPSLLSACGGGSSASSKTVTFGMNEVSGPAAQRLRAMAQDFAKTSGLQVTRNEVDHDTFQEHINTYLQGNPDDVFTWFAGYRMDQFAQQGLIADISDVWPIDGMTDSFKQASTASDGKQYFVPKDYYPWAVFYRKSVFAKNGFDIPTTYDELLTLCKKMKAKGMVPFAFGDKDGWPAMGSFDILNMRINGFQFHMDLMKGKKAWDSTEVKQVFDTWRQLLPYHQPDPLGRIWQEAASALGKGQAGMYLLGTFVVDGIPDVHDLDFFTWPSMDSSIGADALDAPIDGFCMSAASDNTDNAKKFLKFLATPQAADYANNHADAPMIAANSKASTAKYSDLQKKSIEVVGQAKNIAQFMDRDTRSDFASTVMIQALQTWLGKPDDIDGITKSIQQQKVSIFGS